MACKIDKSRPDPYCAAPFLSPAITPDGFKMCSAPGSKSFPNIEFWNEEYMQNIREQWMDDIVPTDCQDCYLNAKPVQGRSVIPVKSKIIPLHFEHLYIARSNRCDLACEMCSATISHTWDKVWGDGKVGILDNDFDLTPYIGDTKNIAISGGNPVLDAKLNDIIDGLDNNKVERFLITSNGSVFPDKMLNKILDKKLKCDVLLIFSIDGPKAFNEKARLGAKQERIYKTINSVIERTKGIENVRICIETTGTNESVLHLIELYKEIQENINMQGAKGPYMIGNICCYPEKLALHNADDTTWEYMKGELFRYFLKRKSTDPLAMQFHKMVDQFCFVVVKAKKRNEELN
jgi:organic radical activating enzyme